MIIRLKPLVQTHISEVYNMAYEFREYPERSWSISNHNIFKQCKRKYYLNCYAHWNGWESSSSKFAKQAYRLKKLEDAYTASGTYIHDVIKSVILQKYSTPEKMYNEVIAKLKVACMQSIRNKEDWIRRPKQYTMLHEYYYNGIFPDSLANEIKERTIICCNNLFKSRSFQEIMEDCIEIIESDEKGEFPNFMFQNMKIYSTLDVLYKFNDEIVIVDWKTGQPDDNQHRLQMLTYVLYVIDKYNIRDIEKIRCVDEYLLTRERFTNIFEEKDLSEIREYVQSSIGEMNTYLEDAVLNKPKEMNAFPTNPSKLCSKCNFLELCPDASCSIKSV